MVASTGSTTLVLVVLLVLLGLVMVAAAAWLVRATRTDTRALGPLEVLGDRGFTRRDVDGRAAVLTSARPEGAVGPAPMVEIQCEPSESSSERAVDVVEPSESSSERTVDVVEPGPS